MFHLSHRKKVCPKFKLHPLLTGRLQGDGTGTAGTGERFTIHIPVDGNDGFVGQGFLTFKYQVRLTGTGVGRVSIGTPIQRKPDVGHGQFDIDFFNTSGFTGKVQIHPAALAYIPAFFSLRAWRGIQPVFIAVCAAIKIHIFTGGQSFVFNQDAA